MTAHATVIQSTSNERLKALLKDNQYIFFEGKKLCSDILAQRNLIVDLLIVLQESPNPLPLPHPELIRETWHVSRPVMAKITELKTIPDVIIASRFRPKKIDFTKCRALLALLEVQDPGNVGTLIRTACAFGFDGVAQIGPSVSLNNRKMIRAAQNAVFQIPIQHFDSLSSFTIKCRHHRIAVYLSTANARQNPLGPEEIIPPCAIVLGNEGSGFTAETLSQYPSVRIPQLNMIESLNVSISGSILMHELRKKWGYE